MNDAGNSVLHVVVNTVTFRRISNKVIKLLINSRADRTIKNKDGKTAADMAFELKNGKLGRILLFYDTGTKPLCVVREKKTKPKRSLGKLIKRLSGSLNNLSQQPINPLKGSLEASAPLCTQDDSTSDEPSVESCSSPDGLTTPQMTHKYRRQSFGGYSHEESQHLISGSTCSRGRRGSEGNLMRRGCPESGIFSIYRFSTDADMERIRSTIDVFEGATSSLQTIAGGQIPERLADGEIKNSCSYKSRCCNEVRGNHEKEKRMIDSSQNIFTSIDVNSRDRRQTSESFDSDLYGDIDLYGQIEGNLEGNFYGNLEENYDEMYADNQEQVSKGSLHAAESRVETKFIDLRHDFIDKNDEEDREKAQKGENDEKQILTNDEPDMITQDELKKKLSDEEPRYVEYTLDDGSKESDMKFAVKLKNSTDEDDLIQQQDQREQQHPQEKQQQEPQKKQQQQQQEPQKQQQQQQQQQQLNKSSTEMLQHCNTMLSAVENLYLMTILKDKYKKLSEGSMGDSEC